jgi:PKD repeat protein
MHYRVGREMDAKETLFWLFCILGFVQLLVMEVSASGIVYHYTATTTGDYNTVAGTTGTTMTPALESVKTYYVRVKGGTASQCDGLSNSDYTPALSGHCAFNHPFWALPPGRTPLLSAGDTLVIQRGTYQMGLGAPNTGTCNANWPWECTMLSLPSGSPAYPTRILGEGWDIGCTAPPVLSGTERAQFIINLTGSNYTEVSCLELTDGSSCVEFHPALPCNRDAYPYGNWSQTGIYGSDARNVTLRDLNIHGLADRGIHAARLSNWSVLNTTIAFNGQAGWDGDIIGDDSDSGLMYFKNVNISWNGCGETDGHQPIGCNGQAGGGYGDGLGTGFTGGNWVFEDTRFLHSTSDGLDLLYHNRSGTITLRRVWSEGNAGNQVKLDGTSSIENSVIIGNCGFFNNKSFTYYINNGSEPGVDPCRAAGDALVIDFSKGSKASVVNTEIYGEGNVLLLAVSEHLPCNGAEELVSRNNIFVGGPTVGYPQENTSLYWNELCTGLRFDNNYSVIFGTRDNLCPVGDHDICADPGIGKTGPDIFSMRPLHGSIAIDHGLPVGTPAGIGRVPNHDIEGIVRPLGAGVDIGAYEFNSTAFNNAPRANFTANRKSGMAPLTVQFTDTSIKSPTSWIWTFGDGSPLNATKRNPVHTYAAAGTYTVSLKATNAYGSSTTTKKAYITVRSTSKVGVFRPSTHRFYLKNGSVNTTVNYGSTTDIPLTGDWNGDGRWDIGVFRPSTHRFYLKNGSVNTTVNWGLGTDIPVTGDWNGDGRFDVGVFRNLTHVFYLKNGSVTTAVNYGLVTDKPVSGIWS